jgi:hypothetical protein
MQTDKSIDFFKSIIDDKISKLKQLDAYLTGDEIVTESKEIDAKWRKVVDEHVQESGPLKLVILAEAPLSFDKYFYNRQGTFLDSLRDFWKLEKNSDLPAKLLENRVLLLDIYRYPIPSEFYKKDENLVLFDNNYVSQKIDLLKGKHLIDDNTFFVFRYKELCSGRNLQLQSSLRDLNYVKYSNKIISLNNSEKPQKLHPVIASLLD